MYIFHFGIPQNEKCRPDYTDLFDFLAVSQPPCNSRPKRKFSLLQQPSNPKKSRIFRNYRKFSVITERTAVAYGATAAPPEIHQRRNLLKTIGGCIIDMEKIATTPAAHFITFPASSTKSGSGEDGARELRKKAV